MTADERAALIVALKALRAGLILLSDLGGDASTRLAVAREAIREITDALTRLGDVA